MSERDIRQEEHRLASMEGKIDNLARITGELVEQVKFQNGRVSTAERDRNEMKAAHNTLAHEFHIGRIPERMQDTEEAWGTHIRRHVKAEGEAAGEQLANKKFITYFGVLLMSASVIATLLAPTVKEALTLLIGGS